MLNQPTLTLSARLARPYRMAVPAMRAGMNRVSVPRRMVRSEITVPRCCRGDNLEAGPANWLRFCGSRTRGEAGLSYAAARSKRVLGS